MNELSSRCFLFFVICLGNSSAVTKEALGRIHPTLFASGAMLFLSPVLSGVLISFGKAPALPAHPSLDPLTDCSSGQIPQEPASQDDSLWIADQFERLTAMALEPCTPARCLITNLWSDRGKSLNQPSTRAW